MKPIKIGAKIIGDGHPCFIIAEAGANFKISNDPELNFKHALRLIDIAAEAKADAVKFQLYKAKTLYVENAGYADYIGKRESIYNIIKDMELPVNWLPKLKSHCDKRGIIFLCSPFDEQSADELEKVDIQAYKIASYELTRTPLIRHIAKKKRPIILSTGASNLAEIRKAVAEIKRAGNNNIVLMQCTAKYPAPLSAINLNVIPLLKKTFDLPVGLSDHSREPLIAPLGAVALGANVVEKHFTTDNGLPGPDHGFAILSDELRELVSGVHKMELCLGKKEKNVLKEELELHSFARSSIYAIADISAGEKFSKENVAVLRSGKSKKGLAPEFFSTLLNKRSRRKIKKNEPIKKTDIR